MAFSKGNSPTPSVRLQSFTLEVGDEEITLTAHDIFEAKTLAAELRDVAYEDARILRIAQT